MKRRCHYPFVLYCQLNNLACSVKSPPNTHLILGLCTLRPCRERTICTRLHVLLCIYIYIYTHTQPCRNKEIGENHHPPPSTLRSQLNCETRTHIVETLPTSHTCIHKMYGCPGKQTTHALHQLKFPYDLELAQLKVLCDVRDRITPYDVWFFNFGMVGSGRVGVKRCNMLLLQNRFGYHLVFYSIGFVNLTTAVKEMTLVSQLFI